MTKLCLRDCVINDLQFYKGCEYKVEYNNYDCQLYIYHINGYTTISGSIINDYFL